MRNRRDCLHAEDGGIVMYVNRLEAGRFKLPEYDGGTRTYSMEWRDLVVMVEGIREDPAQRLRRPFAPVVVKHPVINRGCASAQGDYVADPSFLQLLYVFLE